MSRKLLLALVLLPIVACGGRSAAPTVIVITATPGASTTAVSTAPLATFTPSADGGTVTTTPDAASSSGAAAFVRARQDINIRSGPGTTFDIVGGVYAGQTAKVTGGKSEDGKWWQVECPVATVKQCFVSADPELTEPAATPNVGPTATTTTEVNLETFTRLLASGIANKDYPALKNLMGESFTLAHWRSEGSELTRDDAVTFLDKTLVGPANSPTVDLADKTDQTKLLGGTDPLGLWGKAQVVKTVYVQNLGQSNKDDALFVVAKHPDSTLYWYGILYAPGGFAASSQ